MKKFISLDFIITLTFGFLFLYFFDQSIILNFIVFFLMLAIYLLLDLKIFSTTDAKQLKSYFLFKKIILFSLIFFLLTVSLIASIDLRHRQPTTTQTHDNIQQIEPAIDYLLAGKNPYQENYYGTELESKSLFISTSQGQVLFNPSIFHAIALPSHFLLSIPFHFVSNNLFGFYDQRLVYLVFFIVSLFALFSLPKNQLDKFTLTAFFALNPLFINFFVTGRNDVLILSLIIFVLYFLKNKKFFVSAIFLSLAVTTKHSAVLLLPFYFLYLYFLQDNFLNFKQKVINIFKQSWIFFVLFVLILSPFILWHPAAFYEDVIAYPAGTLATSYPVNGFGFSVFLYQLGIIQNITDHFPFWYYQLPVSLLLLLALAFWQKKNNNLARMIFAFGCFLFVYLFFSRFFHDNYIGFLSQIFLISYFL